MHGAPAKKSSLPGHRGPKPQQHLALPTQGSLRTESGRQRFPEKKKCPSLLLRVPHLWRHPQRPQRLRWQHPQVSENACCQLTRNTAVSMAAPTWTGGAVLGADPESAARSI